MKFPKPSVGMLPTDRLDYSAIVNREPLRLPHGARMVIWTITNVEEWDPTAPMPRTVLTPPAGGSPMPDIPNFKTRGKPILNIPYTQECNDVAMMLIQHHKASEFYERAIDQFEQIYADAKDSARVMAISVHPYIMGAPHRAKYFRKIFERIRQERDVLFWTGEQIADWYLKIGPKAHE